MYENRVLGRALPPQNTLIVFHAWYIITRDEPPLILLPYLIRKSPKLNMQPT